MVVFKVLIVRIFIIEFPTGEVPHYTKQLFFEIQSRGYIPIIHMLKEIEVSPKIRKYYMNWLQMGH